MRHGLSNDRQRGEEKNKKKKKMACASKQGIMGVPSFTV